MTRIKKLIFLIVSEVLKKIVISTWENEKKHDDKLIKILYLESPESIKSLDFDNNILKQFALKIRSNIILDKKTEFFDINDLNKINLPALVPNPITSFNLFAFWYYRDVKKILGYSN